MDASAKRPVGWLFGPMADLLLGCGVAYLAVAALHGAIGPGLARAIPGGLLILLFSLPHYGATLLRVYETAEDRGKYRFFALHATLLLAIAFVVGLHVGVFGSLALTVYLTWSPWHYTGQNYGIGLMLLGRRGVPVSAGAKRLVWGSFVASYLLTALALHGSERAASYAPVSYDGTVFHLLPLGIPLSVAAPAIALTGAAYVALTLAALVALARDARPVGGLAAMAPAMVLMLTQAFWFSVPVLLRLSGWMDAQGASGPFSSYGFLWIAAAHSAQYLWITTYYATHADSSQGRLRFLGKSALAGYAIWTVPGLLFAPRLLGAVSYDSGLALLIASFVNLHHFVLDGAVWKLRDGRVGRILLRSDRLGIDVPPLPGRRRWLRPAIWALGVLSVAVAAVGFWESEFGFRRALARGDFARAERALERFAVLGRDGSAKRTQVALQMAAQKRYDEAALHLERGIEVEPTQRAYYTLGLVRSQQARWPAALAALETAAAMAPERLDTRYHLGLARLESGDPVRAIGDLEAVLEREPANQEARTALVRAKLAARAEGS